MQILDTLAVASPLWLLLGLVLGTTRPWRHLRRSGDELGSTSGKMADLATSLLTSIDSAPSSTLDSAQLLSQDLTHLRSQLAQTQLAYRMVVEISQFRAGYLARSAHELRSPLNSLIGIHQMILADLCDDPAEEREFIAQASESALKLVKLLDRVIDVSKVDYGSDPVQLRPLQLWLILEEVDELSRLQAQNRNLTLQVDFPSPDVYVLADLPRFRQVLLNLVDTPLRLMHEGTVHLTVHLSNDSVHIDIEDDRPIDLWQEPLDWLRQYQNQAVNLATPDLSPGLALIMNQILMESMGGRLDLSAIPGKDTKDPDNSSATAGDASTQKTRIQCSIARAFPN